MRTYKTFRMINIFQLYEFLCKVSKFYNFMNQSSTSVGINLRNKGLRNAGGTLIKGCVKDATTKLSIGSIPSNYETIIYHNNLTKSFGTSQKRFYQESKNDVQKNDLPTQCTMAQSLPKKNHSHSTKGYGPFIAKQQRNRIEKKQAPGPGQYQFKKQADSKIKKFKKRPCFSRQKKQNIGPSQNTLRNESPGPGQYYVYDQKSPNNGWKSSFKSKMTRNTYLQNLNNPGPGYYDVKLIKHAKSVIKQCTNLPERAAPSKMLQVFQQQKRNQIPGPGSYEYEVPNFKPLYERIKISGNFMITKKDRFNNEADKFQADEIQEQAPNIYSYKVKSAFDSEQRLLKWPCFMSESKRMVFSGQKKLGPSFITSSAQNKKNFHFNIKGDWF